MTTPELPTAPPPPRLSRNVVIAGSVVLLHLGLLSALQTGLLRRAVDIVVPVQLLSEVITPPAPQPAPPPPPPPPPPPSSPPPPPPPIRRPVVAPAPPPPAPQPVAIADPTPAPQAPTGVVAPQAPPPPIAAPVAVAPSAPPAPPAAPPAPPAPPPAPAPKIELPSSDADYLNNTPPAYPALSKRLGEQGRVSVRVLIDVDGRARNPSIAQSSGYARLDQTAINTVLKWRFVPGKRAGVPEAMWFTIPINFVLE